MAWKTGIFNNQSFLKHSSVCLCSGSASIHLTKIRSRSIYYGGNTIFPFWQKISIPSWKDVFFGLRISCSSSDNLDSFLFSRFQENTKTPTKCPKKFTVLFHQKNITSRDQLRSQRCSSSPSFAFWHVGLLLLS